MAKDRQAWAVEWLDAIKTDGVNLTAWEENFIEDMSDRILRGREFTEKQIDTIEKIYAERTP